MGAQVDPKVLLNAAWRARERAYAPHSDFKVGAALLTESGKIYSGCNVENISLGLTICAERTAVVAAIQGGQRKFLAIAIAAETKAPTVPCGACRQFLAEFNPKIAIFSEGKAQARNEWSLSDLLPFPVQGILDRSN